MKTEIYSDPQYEQTMSLALERSRSLAQTVLDTWNSLDLGAIKSKAGIYELIHNPSIPFTEGCNKKQIAPPGLNETQVKQYLEKIVLPLPNALYLQAEKARQDPYTVRELGLFEIKKDKVVLNEAEAEKLVKGQSVYVENESQLEFAEDIKKLVEDFNRLNSRVGGRLYDLIDKPLRITPGDFDGYLNAEKYRELLQLIY